MQSVTLIYFSPYPFADAVEFLKSKSAFGALCQRYYGFRNDMVRIGGKALLLAATPLQESLGALGAFLLQLLAQRMMPVAHPI